MNNFLYVYVYCILKKIKVVKIISVIVYNFDNVVLKNNKSEEKG